MKLRGVFAKQSGIFQLWLLFALIILGLLIASLLSIFIGISSEQDMQNPGTLRLIQALSAVFSFLMPALILAWLCSNSYLTYLSLDKAPSIKVFGVVLLALLLFNPTISVMALLNQELVLPPFLQSVEAWMKAKELEMEAIVNLLIQDQSPGALFANLLVIALLAALTEEILFRGAIQRIFEKWTSNHHLVIWMAAIVFSAIHMQFYGFIPRMLIGAYLGYLLYWSKSMWVPIFAHFLNNAIAVFVSRDTTSNSTVKEFISGEIEKEHLLSYTIFAIITFILFCILNKKLKAIVEQAD